MNETRGNSRTKPTKRINNIDKWTPWPKNNFVAKKPVYIVREPLKEREIKSLKDSEKTNECILNIKLTIGELQAIAIATAEHWIKIKNNPTPKDSYELILPNYPKNWKKLNEKLFAIYRINK